MNTRTATRYIERYKKKKIVRSLLQLAAINWEAGIRARSKKSIEIKQASDFEIRCKTFVAFIVTILGALT